MALLYLPAIQRGMKNVVPRIAIARMLSPIKIKFLRHAIAGVAAKRNRPMVNNRRAGTVCCGGLRPKPLLTTPYTINPAPTKPLISETLERILLISS